MGRGGGDLFRYLSVRWKHYGHDEGALSEATLKQLRQLRPLVPDETWRELNTGFRAALFPENLEKEAPEAKPAPGEVSDEERLELIRALAKWWEGVPAQDKAAYTLNSYGEVLGLGPRAPSNEELRERLARQGDADAQRLWFRVLAISSVMQTGRRVEEGREFLRYFAGQGYFDRLFDADGSPAFHDIVQESLAAYFDNRDGSLPEWTYYWRLLYDFEKAKLLIRRHGLVEELHRVAASQPVEITDFFHKGKLPGVRPEVKGLGQSIGKQAFFVVREMLRLGVWGDGVDRRHLLQKAAYYPSRYARRFAARTQLLEQFTDAEEAFSHHDQNYLFSEALATVVERAGVSHHFQDHYDAPLMHHQRILCSRCTAASPPLTCTLPCPESPDSPRAAVLMGLANAEA